MRVGKSLYISVVACNYQKVSIKKLRMLFYSDSTQVILVDYKRAARAANYAHAMTSMIADYKSLHPAKHFYLIVNSLGSHIAHYTARFLH